jgi:hypothetical protein
MGYPEPELVNLFRSPGIDSKPSGPVRQPARLHRLAESIPELLKRLQIRAQLLTKDAGMRKRERDQCIWFSVVLTPPLPPSHHGSVWLPCPLSIL